MFDNQPFPHQSEQTPAAPAAKPSTILDLTPLHTPCFLLLAPSGSFWQNISREIECVGFTPAPIHTKKGRRL
jgi:hypothetical protein